MINTSQLELIQTLNEGYSNIILVIDPTETMQDRVYVAGEFRENTDSVKYFSISRYRDITKIISMNSTFSNSPDAVKSVVTAIENTEQIVKERKFCDKFIWIKF